MFSFKTTGSYNKTEAWLRKMQKMDFDTALNGAAQRGVEALRAATPFDEGETAASWSYTIEKSNNGVTIVWTNSHMAGSAPVAIILQYGHGTGTGGYVQGRDYINPAMRPIFDQIEQDVWKVVNSL